MPVHNADITAIFEEIADLLEIQGANTFRIRAYRNAARIMGDLPQEARLAGKSRRAQHALAGRAAQAAQAHDVIPISRVKQS